MTGELDPAPLRARITAGEAYDFGTHFNDFLVKREQSRATEVFLVRVAGRGNVPPHAHHDMEQTFVFTSGVATVRLWRGKEQRELRCRPGE